MVSQRLVVVELNEQLIILEAFDDSLDHGKVVRPTDVILKSVHHYVLDEVQLKHSKLKKLGVD